VRLELMKATLGVTILAVSVRAFPQQQVSRIEGIVVKAADGDPLMALSCFLPERAACLIRSTEPQRQMTVILF
jgi:hypothetical protein